MSEVWKKVQEETGIDIMSIVMDLTSGRAAAGKTMERISEHCISYHNQFVLCDDGEGTREAALRALLREILIDRGLYTPAGVEIPEEISAVLDINLDLAHRIYSELADKGGQ
jgi:hypothetical protein